MSWKPVGRLGELLGNSLLPRQHPGNIQKRVRPDPGDLSYHVSYGG